MNYRDLSKIPPEQARVILPRWLASHVECSTPDAAATLEAALVEHVQRAELDDVAQALAAYATIGDSYGVQPANTLVRRIGRAFMNAVTPGSSSRGVETLQALVGKPQLWICNHLSYIDTQVTDAVLAHTELPSLDDLLVVAGPKVYTEPFRRFAAMAFHTCKTPQSTQLNSNASGLSPREVAVLAAKSVREATSWGGPVLLYPEGTRSPDGRLSSFLRAAARYTRNPDLVVVPLSVSGSDHLFGRDERMRPGPIDIRVGEPFGHSDVPTGKTEILEEAWRRVRDLLPPERQPADGTPPVT